MAEWLGRLPAVVCALADRWSLTLDAPFRPGGTAAWVAPARDPAGRELVLKVGWRHDEAEQEADGLRAWHGRRAVELHDAHVDGPTTAFLLQRCLPGTALNQALPEPDQDELVAGQLRRLWYKPPSGLSDLCDSWADAFEDRWRAAAGAGTSAGLDAGLVRACLALFGRCPASRCRPCCSPPTCTRATYLPIGSGG